MKTLIIILGITLLCSINNANAQCCSAGNPFVTGLNSGACLENTLGLSLFYQHSYSNEYFEGTKKSNFQYIDNLNFDFSSLSVNYQPLTNLNILADIGYFFDKTQNFNFGNNQKFNRIAQGIGDLTLGTQYFYNLFENNQLSIVPSFKITLPIGQFDQMDGPVILPIDIQPSSGSFKYEFGLSFIKQFANDFTIIYTNTAEVSQRIKTERTNYKYGNLYNTSLTGIYKLLDDLSLLLQIRGQLREKSSDKDYKLINSTGGIYLFVNPQLSFNLMHDLSINFQYELPIYKKVNGIQLTNNYALGLRLSKNINFSKFHHLTTENPDEGLYYKKISVNGLCNMCKERIELITNEFKNVEFSLWDMDTKILTIGYKTEPNFDAIKKSIADAGHDNESYKATDEAYNKLHSCCKYRK